MSDPAPKEMTRDEKIRWVTTEEHELLRLLPANNGHGLLASEHRRIHKQLDIAFVERVITWIEAAEEVGLDTTEVQTNFEYNWSVVIGYKINELNELGDLLKHLPASVRDDYQDLILVSTNRIRWAFNIGRPGGPATEPIPTVGSPKPPKAGPPPSSVGVGSKPPKAAPPKSVAL